MAQHIDFLDQKVVRALTLWRPWDSAILFGGKRIENRPWAPWPRIHGLFICLHAGQKYDRDAAVAMVEAKLYTPPSPSSIYTKAGVIVGVARVTGSVTESDDPWFSGPYGWLLDDVTAFKEPVAAKGMQGLWKVEGKLLEQVREAFKAAA